MGKRKITLSVIKADVGSSGGHTKPSSNMIEECRERINQAKHTSLLSDGLVTHTGDDLCLIMVHEHGVNSALIHQFAYRIFQDVTETAKEEGMYAAGQDLRSDAYSGNIKGAGPGVAEIEFDLLPPHRPAEAFLVFAADKCGPGAFNEPFYKAFVDPNVNRGLIIAPNLTKGFAFEIIDMEYKGEFRIKDLNHNQSLEEFLKPILKKAKDGDALDLKLIFEKPEGDRVIKLDSVGYQGSINILALLRDIDRFGIKAINSNAFSGEKAVSVSTTRLHNILGEYIGKDDPVAIVRTQGIFPAAEEILEAFADWGFITGDCRGSHTRALRPMPINSSVCGIGCAPIISCLAFSLSSNGKLSEPVDMFGDSAFDSYRQKVDEKNDFMRRQGAFGAAMASQIELAYTGLTKKMAELDKHFIFVQD